MFLSKEPMNLNGTKWLVDSRADIVIRYNFSVLDNVSYITYLLTFWPDGMKMHG